MHRTPDVTNMWQSTPSFGMRIATRPLPSCLPYADKPVLLVLNPGSSSIKWTTHNVSALEYADATVAVATGQAIVGHSVARAHPGLASLLTWLLAHVGWYRQRDGFACE